MALLVGRGRQLRLRRRIQLLFVPFVVLLAVDLALDGYLVRERDQALAVVESRLDPGRAALADLLQALVDQETANRGYLITGQEQFLDEYEMGGTVADARLDTLAGLFRGEPSFEAAVERVRSRVTSWRQVGAEFEIAAKRAGRDEDAADLVATGTSTELFDAARNEIASLRAQVTAERVRLDERLDELRSRLTMLRILSLLLAMAFLVVGGWLLVGWIGRPLAELGRAVRAVAAGDLEGQIPSPGPPDLAELGADVEAMRRRILAEVDDASRARAALAKRGMIVLTLQEELAPGRPELPAGVTMASRHLPAEGMVAGDWFDVVPLGPDRIAVALVDVSGHGPESAVFALTTKQLTLVALRSGVGPAAALDWLAAQLRDTGEKFLTAVVLEVDAAARTVRYANAGHPPVLLRDMDGVHLLGPTGPLLGPFPATWSEREIRLPSGGSVAAYSDGVVEAVLDDGSEFGVERLAEALAAADGSDAESMAEHCTAEVVDRWSAHRHDDFTLVVVSLAAASPIEPIEPIEP